MYSTKISLIFACYNVSQYLDKLFQLLVTQPYQNIEIIFVEDCSTDDTREKLQSFSDSRVKLLCNEQNIGAAESRNRGIQIATGEYIWFCDPDDLFENSLLERINRIIQDNNPDMICIGIQEQYELNGVINYKKNVISKYQGFINKDFTDVLVNLEETFLLGYAGNKFYRTEIIKKNNIVNVHQQLKEDFVFNIKFLNVSSNFYILNEPLYFYLKRNDSQTARFVSDYFSIHMDVLHLFLSLIEKRGKVNKCVEKLLANRFIRYSISAIERNTSEKSKMSFLEQKRWLENNIINNSNFSKYVNSPDLIVGIQKVFYYLIRVKMSSLLILLANFISFMKKRLPILFAKLKGN
ncbi:glycosyltransferase family 2 protein [Bisgaard Taxon 10/6]|uniref:glycosyltransferase family 2 protein n=1 Tax=Exercitatus varius TaxID=67857 RepID=UPI00294B06A8|nr:glycosyltransferase family 2 protein [Exercitatus varius]MDG2917698.1 glycosyltransferase family 2 protein [Exercitatus varius]